MSFYLFLETHDIMEKEKERERKKRWVGWYSLNTSDLAEDQLKEDKSFCLLQKDLLEGECGGSKFSKYFFIKKKSFILFYIFW